MTFLEAFWVNSGKSKLKKQNKDTIHFEIAICRMLNERSNIFFSFAEHLKLQKKITSPHALWQVTANQNKYLSIRTLNIPKLPYKGCSGKSNQNKNPSIRTLNISKFLYTGCSGKDAITLALSRSTWNFKKSDFYTFSLSKQMQNKIKKKKKKRTAYILNLLHTGCSTNKAVALLSL